uniref:Uncharacterized protein n=1 Tax=Eutreptiella gymnastica TaxID=73025 RepID=A0A7S4FGE2_9EUGL
MQHRQWLLPACLATLLAVVMGAALWQPRALSALYHPVTTKPSLHSIIILGARDSSGWKPQVEQSAVPPKPLVQVAVASVSGSEGENKAWRPRRLSALECTSIALTGMALLVALSRRWRVAHSGQDERWAMLAIDRYYVREDDEPHPFPAPEYPEGDVRRHFSWAPEKYPGIADTRKWEAELRSRADDIVTAKALTDQERLLLRIFGSARAQEALARLPVLATMSVEDMQDRIAELADMVGRQTALEIVQKAPYLLSLPKGTMEDALHVISGVLGNEAAGKTVHSAPFLLRYDAGRMRDAMQASADILGYEWTLRAAAREPRMFTAEVDVMRGSMRVLVETLGKDGAVNALTVQPSLLKTRGETIMAAKQVLSAILGEIPLQILMRRRPTAFLPLLQGSAPAMREAGEVVADLLGEELAAEAVRVHPSLLEGPMGTCQLIREALEETFGTERAVAMVRGNPEILCFDSRGIPLSLQALVEVFGQADAEELVNANPHLLSTPDASIKSSAESLLQLLSLQELSRLVSKHPSLLRISVRSGVDTLVELLGTTDAAAVVQACPQILRVETEHLWINLHSLLSAVEYNVALEALQRQTWIRCMAHREFSSKQLYPIVRALLPVADSEAEALRMLEKSNAKLFGARPGRLKEVAEGLVTALGRQRAMKVLIADEKIWTAPASELEERAERLERLLGNKGMQVVLRQHPRVMLSRVDPTAPYSALARRFGHKEALFMIEAHAPILLHQGESISDSLEVLDGFYGPELVNTRLKEDLLQVLTRGAEQLRAHIALLGRMLGEEGASRVLKENMLMFSLAYEELQVRVQSLFDVLGAERTIQAIVAHPDKMPGPTASSAASNFAAMKELLGEEATQRLLFEDPLLLQDDNNCIRESFLVLAEMLGHQKTVELVERHSALLRLPGYCVHPELQGWVKELGKDMAVQRVLNNPDDLITRASARAEAYAPNSFSADMEHLQDVCGDLSFNVQEEDEDEEEQEDGDDGELADEDIEEDIELEPYQRVKSRSELRRSRGKRRDADPGR